MSQCFAKYICPTFPRWRRETYLVIGLSLACLPTNLPAFLPVGLWPVSSTYSISWPCCCCCCCYDQCHPPSLYHGQASALLKTFNSRSASLTKLLLQNKENIMSTLSLVFKSLSGQEVFQPLSILAESVTTSFPVVKVVNFRDWAITLQKNDLNVSIDVRSTW